jgi:hypothetical protein
MQSVFLLDGVSFIFPVCSMVRFLTETCIVSFLAETCMVSFLPKPV